jgi:predicted PurR-regulated permease PerM
MSMTFKRLQVYFFLGIFAVSLVMTFLLYRPYLDLILFSGILAILTWPAYQLLLKFFYGQRTLAAFSTIILTLILVLLPLAFLVASLATEAVDVFNKIKTEVSFSDIEHTLARLLPEEHAKAVAAQIGRGLSDVASYAQPVISKLTSNIFSVFSDTVSVIFGIFLVMLGMYYMLKDGPELKKELLNLSPLADSDDNVIYDRIRDAIRAVAVGAFTVSISKGVIGGVTFALLGLQAPVFWGTMIALAHFVPGIGTAIVTAPYIVYLFVTGHFWGGIILLVTSALLIGLVDNVLSPQIIKQRIQIHPLLILLSILGGLSVFGAFGVFFGPIILSVTIALVGIYKKEFRQYLENLK